MPIRFLSREASERRLQAAHLIVRDAEVFICNDIYGARRASIAFDVNKHWDITAAITSILGVWNESFIYLSGWSIWSDDEVARSRLQNLRTSLGETKSLADVPGHLFDWDVREKFSELLFMSIRAGWDTCIVATHRPMVVFTSHEGVVEIWCQTQAALAEVKLNLQGMKMTSD